MIASNAVAHKSRSGWESMSYLVKLEYPSQMLSPWAMENQEGKVLCHNIIYPAPAPSGLVVILLILAVSMLPVALVTKFALIAVGLSTMPI